jgi:hypothetical protein
MTGSINPAVSRVGYGRFAGHVAVFAVGAFLGSAVTFGAMALVGSAVVALAGRWVWVGIVIALTVLVSMRDAYSRTPVPYRALQVPEWIKHSFRPAETAFLYGIQLGVGFLTRFTVGTHMTFMLALPFLGSASQIAIVLALFAAGKCIVIVAAVSGQDYEEMERRLQYRLRWRPLGMGLLRSTSILTSAAILISILTDL